MKLFPTVLLPDLEDKLLIPVENVYLLTPDELLEIKKKTASDAWDAMVNYAINSVGTVPDKEAYLNNLKID